MVIKGRRTDDAPAPIPAEFMRPGRPDQRPCFFPAQKLNLACRRSASLAVSLRRLFLAECALDFPGLGLIFQLSHLLYSLFLVNGQRRQRTSPGLRTGIILNRLARSTAIPLCVRVGAICYRSPCR